MPVALLYPYCTLEEVQKETRNKDAPFEDWFRTCINSASRFIDDHTRRDFLFHDHTASPLKVRSHWVASADGIFLPWPILTLTGITQNSIAIDPDNYTFDVGESVITHATAWPANKFPAKPLYLTGTFGYALEASQGATKPPVGLPGSVRRACVLIASAWTVQNRKEVLGPDGAKESLLDTKVSEEARKLLAPFVLRRL